MTAVDLFLAAAEEDRPTLRRIAGVAAGWAVAEDVVQTALLNAWRRHLSRGRPFAGDLEAMKVWLREVTRRAAQDEVRTRACRPWLRGQVVADPDFWLAGIPDGDDPVEIAEHRETSAEAREFLRPFLAQLSPVYREVLWTTYGRGLTAQEASPLIGKSWTAIKTIRDRARRRVLALAAQGQAG